MHRSKIGMAFLVAFVGCVAALAEETQTVYLSGQGKDDPVPWEFFCTAGRNSGQWTTIGVPSNWELQGFGTLQLRARQEQRQTSRASTAARSTCPADWAGKARLHRLRWRDDGYRGLRSTANPPGRSIRAGSIASSTRSPIWSRPATTSWRSPSARSRPTPASRMPSGIADYWVFGGIYRPGPPGGGAQAIHRVARHRRRQTARLGCPSDGSDCRYHQCGTTGRLMSAEVVQVRALNGHCPALDGSHH